MLQPIGSLAPEIYWRRRAVTLVVLLSVLALLGWGALSVANSASSDPVLAGAAVTSSAPAGAAPAATIAEQATSGEGAVSADQSPSAAESLTTSAAEATPAKATPAKATPAEATPEKAAPTPPPAPVACRDKVLKVVAAAGKATYRVGDTPILVLSVINQGKIACIRDLDAAKQEVLIYQGATRLWSSNDCYPESSTDVRTLQPGEMAQFTVEWSGLSSNPGCTGDRPRVQLGTYKLRAKQGAIISADAKITLTA